MHGDSVDTGIPRITGITMAPEQVEVCDLLCYSVSSTIPSTDPLQAHVRGFGCCCSTQPPNTAWRQKFGQQKRLCSSVMLNNLLCFINYNFCTVLFLAILSVWFRSEEWTVRTCEASRFDSNSSRPSDSIRFEWDWPIRKFSNRIGRACSFARRKLSQTT